MASPSSNCTNTDISGIGVRSATYAQNLLSFVPAVVALFNDGKISNNEREFIHDQSTNILLTAFGLLLSAIIQAQTAQGLDNYHLALVLNLSWMNNTNTFIYMLLLLHRMIWRSPPTEWSWGEVFRRVFRILRRPSKDISVDKSVPGESKTADESAPRELKTADKSGSETAETLLDTAVWIGSLHLALMGALGIWLWSNPTGFGSSPSCLPGATTSVLGHAFPMGSHTLRVFSLIVYAVVLIPIANLVLPLALILMPYFLCPLGKWDNLKKRESAAVWCVALGLATLFTINVVFIVDIELSISQNESRQAGQDKLWTLGQTLALLLLVVPIKGLGQYLSASFGWSFRETELTRALKGFRTYNANVPWETVQRWRWKIDDRPVKVNNEWLSFASAAGQLDIVRFLFENGADVGGKDHRGELPLFLAVKGGHLDTVRFLLENGVDVNREDWEGKLPLLVAVEKGYLDIFRCLVEHSAEYGLPLCQAAGGGHLNNVHFLVEHGADVNKGDTSGRSPLSWAAQGGHLDTVCFLVQHGADVNKEDTSGRSPLYWAAQGGHLDTVRFLVQHGADVNKGDIYGQPPLSQAAQRGHLDTVHCLVEHGADVNRRALSQAAQGGHLDTVRFLVEHGADVNKGALSLAAWGGHLDTVRFLVEHGADVNKGALSQAAQRGHLDTVHFLVGHGADVNKGDMFGRSPLSLAAWGGHLDTVRFLVEHGADVNNGGDWRPPLCWAAEGGHLDTVRILVEHGADVNKKDVNGNSPLAFAKQRGHSDVVNFLLNAARTR
ncbi:ankyrin repeat-containing domain protein [Mycena haematopus]|nr:ankyrin repeat-containing domain protein [Mycena haematopus]